MTATNEFAMLIKRDEFALIAPGSMIRSELHASQRPLVVLAIDSLVEHGAYGRMRIVSIDDGNLVIIHLHRTDKLKIDDLDGFAVHLVLR